MATFGNERPIWTDREYDFTFTPDSDLTGFDVERYLVAKDGSRHQVGGTQGGTDGTEITGFTVRFEDLPSEPGSYTLQTVTIDGDGNEETLQEDTVYFTQPSD